MVELEKVGRGADSVEGWGRSALERDWAALNIIRCTKANIGLRPPIRTNQPEKYKILTSNQLL